MNIPKKNKKDAETVIKNGNSLKGTTKSMKRHGFGAGGSRDLTVRLAMISSPRIRKAAALIAHGKPFSAIRWLTIIGKMT